jgi:hypothetical protein
VVSAGAGKLISARTFGAPALRALLRGGGGWSDVGFGLQIIVCHFPPGTSKWNKIEHRMFSFMSLNARGKPLETREIIINLIVGTTTNTGLKIYAQLDDREYEKGVTVTDQQLAAVKITRDPFHGDWNYSVAPSLTKS